MSSPCTYKNTLYTTAAIFTFASLYQLIFYDYGINMLDGGLLLSGAERTLRGEVPLIDFIGYPPGKYYYIALFFKLFGISIHTARLAMLFVTSSTLVLVYLVSRYLMPMPYSIIPSALLLLAPTGYHARFFAFLMIFNILILFNYIRTRSRPWLLAAAISSGASLYFRIDIGSFAIASGVFMILLQRFYSTCDSFTDKNKFRSHPFKESCYFLLMVILVLSPVIIYSLLNPDFFLDLVYYFRIKRNIFTLPNPLLYFQSKDVGKKVLFESAIFYYPFFLYMVVSITLLCKYIRHGKKQVNGYMPAVIIFGVQSLNYPLWFPDLWHALTIYPLVFILTGYFLYIAGEKVKKYIDRNLTVGGIVLCLIPLSFAAITIPNYGFIFGSIGAMRGDHAFLNYRRSNIFVPSEKHRVITEIVEYIKENSDKDDKLFVIPHEVMWYFLCERRNPTGYDYLLPGMIDNIRQLKIIDNLIKDMPKFVIYQDTSLNGKDETRIENFAGQIYNFIINNYVPVKEVGEYTIFLSLTTFPPKLKV